MKNKPEFSKKKFSFLKGNPEILEKVEFCKNNVAFSKRSRSLVFWKLLSFLDWKMLSFLRVLSFLKKVSSFSKKLTFLKMKIEFCKINLSFLNKTMSFIKKSWVCFYNKKTLLNFQKRKFEFTENPEFSKKIWNWPNKNKPRHGKVFVLKFHEN